MVFYPITAPSSNYPFHGAFLSVDSDVYPSVRASASFDSGEMFRLLMYANF